MLVVPLTLPSAPLRMTEIFSSVHVSGPSAPLRTGSSDPLTTSESTEIKTSPVDVIESFRGKKVFITGHTGFKGSWLTLLLSNAGAILKGYALAPDGENALYSYLEPDLKIDSVIADIRDAANLRDAITTFEPDFVFHLAAQPLVRYSYTAPVETFEVNVMGTVHLLEALRHLPNKCTAVIVTTDKVYENNESGVPFKETDPLGGHDPYSSSKAACEIVVASYLKSYFSVGVDVSELAVASRQSAVASQQSAVGSRQLPVIGIATARAGNVIGGGDWAKDRIIPDLVAALESGNTLQVRNPGAVRPWQHVLDPLFGYLQLAMLLHNDPEKYSGSYNFGPNPEDQLTVNEIVELALKSWGSGTYIASPPSDAPHEAAHLRLDISKAKTELGWEPKWNATTAVERTVEWYKNILGKSSNKFESCMKDINAFMN